MLQILNINPFVEAMFYYWGIANDERSDKKYSDAIRRFPTRRDEIKKAADTAAMLEKRLDSKLKINESLIPKYFKKIESDKEDITSGLTGFCLASAILSNSVLCHLQMSPEEMNTYLHKMKSTERMQSFLLNISLKYEGVPPTQKKPEDVSNLLASLPIPDGKKYLILDAFFNYKPYLAEVLSLIMPAAKIIKASEDIYKSAEEKFKTIYSGDDAMTLCESCFNNFPKFPDLKVIRAVPLLLGFDIAYGHFRSETEKDDENNIQTYTVIDSCIGLIRHIRGNYTPQDEITLISESMKTLSDSKRLEMLFYLCSHRAYGQELCNEFDLKQPTMSYHIQKLMYAGFVTVEISGNKTYYTADKDGIRRMLDVLSEKIK